MLPYWVLARAAETPKCQLSAPRRCRRLCARECASSAGGVRCVFSCCHVTKNPASPDAPCILLMLPLNHRGACRGWARAAAGAAVGAGNCSRAQPGSAFDTCGAPMSHCGRRSAFHQPPSKCLTLLPLLCDLIHEHTRTLPRAPHGMGATLLAKCSAYSREGVLTTTLSYAQSPAAASSKL